MGIISKDRAQQVLLDHCEADVDLDELNVGQSFEITDCIRVERISQTEYIVWRR